MKLRHRRMERKLIEGTEIGQKVTSASAIAILKLMIGPVSDKRGYRHQTMAFIPTMQGMAYLLRISPHFEKCEVGMRKKNVWRRIV
tara:strand:- start:183 stop:440 length:258 start_codon:yes stop_codon:yes gene_type:complete